MKYLRIIFKPFKLRDWVDKIRPEFTAEEVTGLGYHPERLSGTDKALLPALPRMAAELKAEDAPEIETHRTVLRTASRRR
jgi:hypothetical protein